MKDTQSQSASEVPEDLVPLEDKFKNWARWEEAEEEIIKQNFGVIQYAEIAHILGRSIKSVSERARKLGLTRSTTKSYVVRKFNLNQQFFNVWSAESAYMLGFWVADGYMKRSRRAGSTVGFCIHEKDKELLLSFAKAIGCDDMSIVRHRKTRPMVVIEFNSTIIYDAIINLGGTPRKTLTINNVDKVPDEYFHHFVRGFLDGDGCIFVGKIKDKYGVYPYLRTTFPGGEDFLVTLSNRIARMWDIPAPKVSREHFSQKFDKYYCVVTYYGAATHKLCQQIYRDCGTMFLQRKYDIYKNYMENKLQIAMSKRDDGGFGSTDKKPEGGE